MLFLIKMSSSDKLYKEASIMLISLGRVLREDDNIIVAYRIFNFKRLGSSIFMTSKDADDIHTFEI